MVPQHVHQEIPENLFATGFCPKKRVFRNKYLHSQLLMIRMNLIL